MSKKEAKNNSNIENNRDLNKTRSSGYQPVLLESPYSPEMLSEFSDSQGFITKLNPFAYSEELFELKDSLRKATWEIIDTQLTDRQKEVLHLCADGYTQIEVAKKLKVNQSSITKSLHGNCDYRNGRVSYGGSIRRLKRLISKDTSIQELLKRIAELQDD